MKRSIKVVGFSLALFCLTNCSSGVISRQLSPAQEAEVNTKLVSLLTDVTRSFEMGTPSALDNADSLLQLSRELAPEDPRVIDGLGCLAWRRGEFLKAWDYFEKAVLLDPNYDRGYVHLAIVAERNGDVDAAYALLQIALHLNPLNYRARNNYAAILFEQGEVRKSYTELLKTYGSGAKGEEVIELNLDKVTR